MSIDELPCLHAPYFCVLPEGLFAKLITPEVWDQAWVDFITSSSKKASSGEIVSMAILITDGVGEGKLGMMTIFCHSDLVKVEPSVMFLTLAQQYSHEPAVVVMNIFTSPTFFPWGSFGLSFLDIATLSEGVSTIKFPLSWLHLHQLLLFSPNQDILPRE